MPAVVYGLGSDPVAGRRRVARAAPGPQHRGRPQRPDHLEVDGSADLTIVKDLQRHPVRRNVAPRRLPAGRPRRAHRPSTYPSSSWARPPKLEADEGIVDQLLHTLTIKAKPGDIPTRSRSTSRPRARRRDHGSATSRCPTGVTTEVDPEEPVVQRQRRPARRSIARAEAAEAAGEDGDEGEAADGRRRPSAGPAPMPPPPQVRVGARRGTIATPPGHAGRPAGGRPGQPRRRVRRHAATTSASRSSTLLADRHGGRLRKGQGAGAGRRGPHRRPPGGAGRSRRPT